MTMKHSDLKLDTQGRCKSSGERPQDCCCNACWPQNQYEADRPVTREQFNALPQLRKRVYLLEGIKPADLPSAINIPTAVQRE